MHKVLWLALVLVVVWLLLRFALAVTGAFLHVLWVIALVMFVVWLVRLLRGGGRPVA
jgi:hypothetical protein